MQTYSHFLITAALGKRLKAVVEKKRLPPLRGAALLWGSVLPDLPLILISLVCGLLDWRSGLEFGSEAFFESSKMGKLFNDWFFNNPWVISAQSLFHSPVLLSVYGLTAYFLWTKKVKTMAWLFWLVCSCFFHSLIDILVHHNDGPLLLFPFSWTFRFHSPVSYWDPNYYGIPFGLFEHTLDLLLILGFVLLFFRRRAKKRLKP